MNFNQYECRGSTHVSEIWKPIIGYEDLYKISNHGRVLRLPKTINNRVYNNSILKAYFSGDYLACSFLKNGERKILKIHRLVAIYFLDPVPGTDQVNHIDGVKTNNHYTNLEWVTCKQNMDHAVQNKLIYKGITPKDKRIQIIDLHNENTKVVDIVEKTGVPKRTVFEIIRKYKNGENVIY